MQGRPFLLGAGGIEYVDFDLHEVEIEALGLAARAQAAVADTLGVELDLITRMEG
jgi:hypothetical protein